MKQRKPPNVNFNQIISDILSSTFSKFETLKMVPTRDIKNFDISNQDIKYPHKILSDIFAPLITIMIGNHVVL